MKYGLLAGFGLTPTAISPLPEAGACGSGASTGSAIAASGGAGCSSTTFFRLAFGGVPATLVSAISAGSTAARIPAACLGSPAAGLALFALARGAGFGDGVIAAASCFGVALATDFAAAFPAVFLTAFSA